MKNQYYYKYQNDPDWKWWALFTILALVYPILISVHNFLPFFFGTAGYALVVGIHKRNTPLISISTLYLVNLEINLSLPLFCSIIAVLIFAMFVLPKLKALTNCKECVFIASIVLLYVIYYMVLVIDDFIFSTANHNIDFSWLLLYSFFIDVLLMVFL